jgi:2-haloacid dehalogenase
MALLFYGANASSHCCEEVVVSVSNRWVTFDCFGTLVDWRAWFAEVLGPLGGRTAADVARAYHAHERVVERDYPHRAYKDVLVTALERATGERGVRLPSHDARTILTAGWPSMRLFDDVEAMLAELRANGCRLAVLTNCDEDLFAVTHRLFKVPFDLVLTAERVRGYKPERWHFRGFEKLTGVVRPNWVHVANSWYHDIAPARELGVRHVWLDRDRTGEDGGSVTVRIESAFEVPSTIRALFAGAETAASRVERGRPDERIMSAAVC